MSRLACTEPSCESAPGAAAIETLIDARPRDLGGFAVRRLLPAAARRMVGPFIFFDHMGPAHLPPGQGMDVRPHPHIGLSTVTYLFEGEIVHRDSTGAEQTIRPGDLNWMTAGRGIVHSERTSPELRETGLSVHGLQLWVALPRAQEQMEPEFRHQPADTLPVIERQGAHVRVIAGSAYGVSSPLRGHSPLFFADARLPTGSVLEVPSEHRERAVYVVSGRVRVLDAALEIATAPEGRMLVLAPGKRLHLRAEAEARVAFVGGEPIDGERFIDWNFVASDRQLIEQAKRAWRERRFPVVPGDDSEFIPLP